MKLALDFIELGMGKQFAESFQLVRDSLRKINSRMIKLAQKKENPLLAQFQTEV